MTEADGAMARLAAGLSSQINEFNRTIDAAARSLAAWYTRVGPRIAETLTALAVAGLEVRESIPSNLRSGPLTRIEPLGELSRQSGVAVVWVIPPAHIDALLAAPDPIAFVSAHREPILEHCDDLLDRHPADPSTAAAEVLEALQAGCWPAAQSHAANVIDSLILPEYPRRADVVVEASRSLTGEEELRAYMRQFALLPMIRAYRPWHPGDPQLEGFSRHATAHAVHQPWAVTPDNALIAAILAVSLAIERRDRTEIPRSGISARALTRTDDSRARG